MTAYQPVLSRRLAIQILHEAQIAQPASITGWVCEKGGEAGSFHLGHAGQPLWARCYSNPTTEAVPTAAELTAGGLHLVISLNTKGVLEMRAWELEAGQPVERVLKIRD